MSYNDLLQTKNCACANLRGLTRLVTNFYDSILEPSGLRITQFTLLAALAKLGTVSLKELGEALMIDPTTLNRNLKPLEKQGLVESHSGEDQRTRLVSLSEQGQARFNEILPLWEQAQTRLIDGLGQEKLQAFLNDLHQVAGLLQ